MPMEQAPLVYSSSHQIGAHVSAGTPNNPGLEVSVGYKGLDAAYVPVAVAKACRTGAACENDIYRQVPIAGSSNEGDDPSQQIALEGAMSRVTRLTVQQQKEQARYDALVKLRNDNIGERQRLATLQQEQTRLELLVSAIPPTASALEVTRSAAVAQEIKAIGLLETEEMSNSQIDRQAVVLNDVTNEIAKASSQQSKLEDAIAARRKDVKGDAFSVYGRFDGGTSGEANGARLELGKVFSTGIAAQNLTQGIRESAKLAAAAISRTQCLSAVELAASRISDSQMQQVLRSKASNCLE